MKETGDLNFYYPWSKFFNKLEYYVIIIDSVKSPHGSNNQIEENLDEDYLMITN